MLVLYTGEGGLICIPVSSELGLGSPWLRGRSQQAWWCVTLILLLRRQGRAAVGSGAAAASRFLVPCTRDTASGDSPSYSGVLLTVNLYQNHVDTFIKLRSYQVRLSGVGLCCDINTQHSRVRPRARLVEPYIGSGRSYAKEHMNPMPDVFVYSSFNVWGCVCMARKDKYILMWQEYSCALYYFNLYFK